MNLPKKIGRYQILEHIATGGMGEIYLAYDPLCERSIVIKRIREELLPFKVIKQRFLKEAKIAAKLTHPSIIKIYVIHDEEPLLYYTMPYVEGETLKKILHSTKKREEEGETPHEIGVSIPSLIRIFQTVCFAMAYSHSQSIIHRDLKPENLIIGKFGEVSILDWGIACKVNHEDPDEEPLDIQAVPGLTQPGKVLGTLNYMAPERAKGEKAHFTTDIYALGVILYQLLTLQMPFRRPSLEHFKKNMHLEMLLEPSEIAPYRDIPKQLSDIAKKCLSFNAKERYQSITELLADLEQYVEGKPGWSFFKQLDPEKKDDWVFQENVLIAKHVALTRSTKEMQWFYLMLSKEKFTGNIRLEIDLLLKEHAEGLGFLLCIPEPSVSKGFEEGYCIWLHLKGQKVILMRSNVEVLTITSPLLEEGKVHHIAVEKIDDSLQCSINGKLILNYVSHMPLFGAHLGILSTDMNYSILSYKVFLGSYHILTNCLSIPDAFLAGKDYSKALEEYRRIGTAFEGRTEGREALFRAGITLLEQTKSKKNGGGKTYLLDQAVVEFERLRYTPSAPLEYLGKSMVYAFLEEIDEEVKCFELILRKYPSHPLIQRVEERVAFRLSQRAKVDRKGAFTFSLLALRHLPHIFQKSDERKLLQNLLVHLEMPYFFQFFEGASEDFFLAAIQLSFWLSKPKILREITEKHFEKQQEIHFPLLKNVVLILGSLGFESTALELLNSCLEKKDPCYQLLEIALSASERSLIKSLMSFIEILPNAPSKEEMGIFYYLIHKAMRLKTAKQIAETLEDFEKRHSLPLEEKSTFQEYRLWALLLTKQWGACKKIFEEIPLDDLSQTGKFIHLLYGCYLSSQEGREIADAYLSGIIPTAYPKLNDLLSYFLIGKISLSKQWLKNAFFWEKVTLFNQLTLYYNCLGNCEKADEFEKKSLKLFLQQKKEE